MTIQVKAIEQYSPVVLYRVTLTFESAVEIKSCEHSNESH